jgi:hypothetical protein
MAEATARDSRWRAFRAPDTAGAIYGTIAAMAVVAGAARHPSHGRVLALMVATLLVFWLVSSLSAPADGASYLPRPRYGRSCSPAQRDGPHGARMTRDQHQRNDHAAWSPPPGCSPVVRRHAGNLPRTHLRGLVRPAPCLLPQPSNRHPGAGPAPCSGQAASGAPQPARVRSGGPGLPSTATHREPNLARPAQRRVPDSARCGQRGCTQGADAGRLSVRTPASHRPRGHRTPGHRTSAASWTDVRTADSGGGQSEDDVADVRTSWTETTATAGWAAKPRLGCSVCGAWQPHDGLP